MFQLINGMLETGMSIVRPYVGPAIESINNRFAGTPPAQLIMGAAAATAALFYAKRKVSELQTAYRARHSKTYKQRLLDVVVELARTVPQIDKKIMAEMAKSTASTMEKIAKERKGMKLSNAMPVQGVAPLEILKQFYDDPHEAEKDWAIALDGLEKKLSGTGLSTQSLVVNSGDGKDSGAVYAVHTPELQELLKLVYAKTNLTNYMHGKWPRLKAMKAEVIRWCQRLFHGDDDGYGLITHGGTSSICEAMIAYVVDARARGIEAPEIVVPSTRHAAFDKAAALSGARLVVVPVDPSTGQVSAKKMAGYLSKNTAVMVGSAPSFMDGVADPIIALGELAHKKKIPFHVDACLGGFLTAFMKDGSMPPMDFRVKGVTSISADLHKYGLCPKGTSILLFAKDAAVNSVYAALNWCGGLYATPGMLDGSVCGARVAEIYTVLSYYGRTFYETVAARIIALKDDILSKLEAAGERLTQAGRSLLRVFSTPIFSVIGFRSDNENKHFIHIMGEHLQRKGWAINFLNYSDGIKLGFHMCLTMVHTLVDNFSEKFVKALVDSVDETVRLGPKAKPSTTAKVYGAVNEKLSTRLQAMVSEDYEKEQLRYKGDEEEAIEPKLPRRQFFFQPKKKVFGPIAGEEGEVHGADEFHDPAPAPAVTV